MARRGEGPGCAAAGEVEGGEDRGCGLGFESQPHRHCSRAPSRGGARRGAELAVSSMELLRKKINASLDS